MPDRDIRPGVARLFRLATTRRSAADRDIDDEIRFHLEERERQLLHRGFDAANARIEAERRFGDLELTRATLRRTAQRRDNRMALRQRFVDGTQDVRFALRSLRRAPGFLAVAVLCLALGIGGNAAIFSVIDAVLLKPLPYNEPTQLVRIWPNASIPPGIFDIVKRDSRAYAAIGGVEHGRHVSMTGAGEPTRALTAQATDGFFDVMGVRPQLGRTFRPGENELTAPLVAVISHALWQTHFGNDSSVVGTTISLDGLPREIIGVMPPHFAFPSSQVQLWTPAKFIPGSSSYWWTTYLQVVARLQPTSTVAEAKAEAAVVFDGARSAFPMRMPDEWGKNVDVVQLHESIVGNNRSTMLLMFGAVALVLLIACVNVAGLYLGRAALREREMAVRTALGAGRSRLVRLLLVESTIVSTLGMLAGLALAYIGTELLVSTLPADTPRVGEIGIDIRVVGFALLLMLVSATVFGLLPALRTTGRNMMPTLRTDDRAGTSRHAPRTGFVLATAQVALAVTLVTGAGLLLKSFWQLRQVDLGFEASQVFTAEVPLPSFASDTARHAPVFYNRVIEELRAMPGVRSATVASSVPFGDGIQSAAMAVEAHPTPPGGAPPSPNLIAVANGYFETLRIPLIRGRLIASTDRANTERIGVVDEAAAAKLWPNEDAIGQRIRFVWSPEWYTVVGIVGNVKRDSMSSSSEPSLYVPMEQSFVRRMRVVIDVAGNPGTAARIIQAAVRSVDPTVPVSDVRSLDGLVAGSASRPRFAAVLLSLFSGIALVLGAVGIYGVLAASVARRTREFGVRMALGATAGQVLRLVLLQSVTITVAGIATGALGVFWATSALRGMLFGVVPTDATVLAAVMIVLALVTLLSSLVPALRATRVNPLTAIRAE